MFLVLKQDPTNPAGWTPTVLTATETAEQAAAEGNPGHDAEIAVIEWDPTVFSIRTEPVVELVETPQMRAEKAGK